MTVDSLIETIRKRSTTKTLAVAYPHDPVTLAAARDACDEDIARSILFGSRRIIEQTAGENNIHLDGIEIVDIEGPEQAVNAAIAATAENRAHMLMKGDVTTRTVISAVLHAGENIISPGKLLSDVAVFHSPAYNRPMILTDPGINISPNIERKIQIIKNAVETAHRIGIRKPKVALLAAIEKLNISHMPITVEAELIEKMGRAGLFGDALVEGPFALDNAVDEEAARIKHVTGKVAGNADILVVPDIEAGNILYKSIVLFAGIPFANVVVGARIPIVLPSRIDCEKTKLASIAIASYLSE